MIKLIACDLDGTLLKSDGKLNPEFYDLFHKLREKGVIFSVATGRQYQNAQRVFQPIANEIMIMGDNGACIGNENKIMFSDLIDKKVVHSIIDYVRTIPNTGILLCGETTGYIDIESKEMDEFCDFYGVVKENVPDLKEIEEGIFKIAICDFVNAKTNSCPLIEEKFKDVVKVVASGSVWIDITNLTISKGSGIEFIQNKFNIKPEESIAIGDNDNDLDMFEKVEFSFAMANGSENAKNKAKYKAESNDDDGVLKIIKDVLENKL